VLDKFEHKLALARRDVCQTPNCFELKLSRLHRLGQLEEPRDQVPVHSFLNGRVQLEGEKLAQEGDGEDLDD